MQITLARNPIHLEACDPEGLYPAGYFFPPSRFVEPDSEGRLIESLRAGARRAVADGGDALVQAVLVWIDGDTALATALADLTVSGRIAHENFIAAHPVDADVSAAVNAAVGRELDPEMLGDAVSGVLDRAYQALWTILHRGSPRTLGWIAVWAEVDSPYRPVNVPGTRHTQFDITVPVRANGLAPSKTVESRYAVFNDANIPEAVDIEEAARSRLLPPAPTPAISESSRLLFYMHGHSSRLEEGEKLGEIFDGREFTLISMDLPCNGYSKKFDHIEIAPDSDTDTLEAFPLLEFIEQYVIDIVSAIGEQIGRPIESQVAAMIGGSLGGNLALRLAKREMDDHPWMNNFVGWSAASVWTPYTGIPRETGPNVARANMQQRDYPERREEYIRQVFDDSTRIFAVKPQGEYWYRDDGWEPCKTLYLAGSREDRRELYSENFRRWHWRVALEQMLFSHRHPVSRLEKLRARILIMAGEGDDYPWTHIHDSTRDMAMLCINTPGALRRLKNTGHSIHDERPQHLSLEIRRFLPYKEPIDDSDSHNWVAWISIGGSATSEPAVIAEEDGRLTVFVRGEDNRIWRAAQAAVNGGWRPGFVPMTGGLDGDDTFGTFAVERNWDGRLEIFAFYIEHGWIAHAWQGAANGAWNNWDKGNHISQLIGGAADGVFAVERFGEAPVEVGEDGLRFDVGRRWLLVGSRRTNGRIHIRGQNNYGWWTNGRDLGQESVDFVGTPTATRLSNGNLIIFARDTANQLWRIQEESPDDWQDEWQSFSDFAVSGDVSAAIDADGKLVVAARSNTGQIMLRREIFPNGDWGAWSTIDAALAAGSEPTLIRNPWGELQIYVRWTDGSIRTKRQRLGLVREWTDWGNLGGNATLGPVVEPQANGMPIIFYVGADQQVYFSLIASHTLREVSAVRRDDGAITHLCNEGEDWSPIDVDTVIEEITAGREEYTVVTPGGLRNTVIARRVLTTQADESEDNNLGSLPVIRPDDAGWPLPPDDLIERQITHVIKYADDPLFSIRGVCNPGQDWSVDRPTAFNQIRNGTHQYFIIDGTGGRNAILAVQYLTTRADETEENNLDSLPDC